MLFRITAIAVLAASGMAPACTYATSDSKPKMQSSTYSVPLKGFAHRIQISPNRKNILVAAVKPDGKPKKGQLYGLYTFSLENPRAPKKLGFFPIVRPEDFSLSPDGKTAYVIGFWGDGFPQGTQHYGLFVVDISRPEAPTLIAHVEGSFFALGLSRKGDVLLVQEHKLGYDFREYGEEHIRAYNLTGTTPSAHCSVQFNDGAKASVPVFAYSFITFPDNDILAINDRGGTLRFYNIDNPCQPRAVTEIPAEDGSYVVGWKGTWLLGGNEGLSSYRYTTPDERWKGYSWGGTLSNIRVFEGVRKMTAKQGNTVLIFGLEEEGKFSLLRKYRTPPWSGDAVIAENSMLYVGGTGWLRAIKMKALGSNPAVQGTLRDKAAQRP